MGSNRRYAQGVAADVDRQILTAVTKSQPISLSDDELDKDHQHPHQPSTPIPVRAWVRYPEMPVRADGYAIAWTDRAVLVEWPTMGGGVARAWVWASAVERKAP